MFDVTHITQDVLPCPSIIRLHLPMFKRSAKQFCLIIN